VLLSNRTAGGDSDNFFIGLLLMVHLNLKGIAKDSCPIFLSDHSKGDVTTANVYVLNTIDDLLCSHYRLSKITEQKTKLLSLCAIAVLAGHSDFTNSFRHLPLSTMLTDWRDLVDKGEENDWIMPENHNLFIKAIYMRVSASPKFREPGYAFNKSGSAATFDQSRGTKGDPRLATNEQVLEAVIGKYDFVQGEPNSLKNEQRWPPSSDEIDQLLLRVNSVIEYWRTGVTSKDLSAFAGTDKWKGHNLEGRPVPGISWREELSLSNTIDVDAAVPAVTQDGGSSAADADAGLDLLQALDDDDDDDTGTKSYYEMINERINDRDDEDKDDDNDDTDLDGLKFFDNLDLSQYDEDDNSQDSGMYDGYGANDSDMEDDMDEGMEDIREEDGGMNLL
jgi:hypothetical protein